MTTNKIDTLVAGIEARAAEIAAVGAKASMSRANPAPVSNGAMPEDVLLEAFHDQFAATLAHAAAASVGSDRTDSPAANSKTIDGDFEVVEAKQPGEPLPHKESRNDD